MGVNQQRSAIVTGAGRRVGRAIAQHLVETGWNVIAHVRSDHDPVPEGAIKAVADLSQRDCAARILAAADGLAPLRLLVNNAAMFAPDQLGATDVDQFDAHMHVNLRAPVLLAEGFAALQDGSEDSLVVNLVNSKIAAPNPDFLSYTLSKFALDDFTRIAARGWASTAVRVNAIAPSLMLRSPGQSAQNFAAMHAYNPLGRGVTTDDVIAALDFLIASKTVTGQTLLLDSGQRFMGLARDVQFLGDQ